MITMPLRLPAAALLLAALSALQPVRAAESYDSCTGFIDSVPATLTTQGVWCLRKDLATAITSGNAITIATNNVTVDCNGFKLGGLAAGNASNAYGIHANSRQNVTVRNCNIRGFLYGIRLLSGAGHLIEDNRLDNSLQIGIEVYSSNSRVRRNAVYDTGGKTGATAAYAILASGQIIDNTVSGLFVDMPGGYLTGIYGMDLGSQVRGNSVSGFDMTATQGGNVDFAYGIYMLSPQQSASGNQIVGGPGVLFPGRGIYTTYASSFCQDNIVAGFTINISAGCISSGNLVPP